jgi:uncharacterized membrane protein
MSAEPSPGRLWEVDVVRTGAILMMVAYHAVWDVFHLAPSVDVNPFDGGWRALQVACGSTFLFVVGVSLAISNARGRARGLRGWPLYRRHLRRAAQVTACALLVTVATVIALGDEYVRFGILHCIAVAMVVGPLLLPLGWWNVPLGAAAIALGVALGDRAASDVPGLFVLGVPPAHGTVDWYPLLPWLGPMMIGLAVGRALYPGGRRGRWGERLPEPSFARTLGAPGRHALPIYLVHQGVLIPLVAVALAVAGIEVSGDFFT